MVDLTTERRFWKKVRKTRNCWFWTGAKTQLGYGLIYMEWNHNYRAHRLSWAIANYRFPYEFILHKCDNRDCVNPKHLYEGNHLDNMHDMINRKRHGNQKKTHCPKGHKYNKNSIYMDKPYRQCKLCNRSRHWAELDKMDK